MMGSFPTGCLGKLILSFSEYRPALLTLIVCQGAQMDMIALDKWNYVQPNLAETVE